MKKILCLLIIVISALSSSAGVIMMKHGVEFDHKGHQIEKVGDCSVCHEDQVGRIKGFGKDWAHNKCIACHSLNNEGRPANCGGCHKTMGLMRI